MKKITTHSKSGLFLMEMIFVLLFLSLSCGICVRLFAASYTARISAREADHMQELITSAGEILEGTDGTNASFLKLLPDGIANQGKLYYYFDKEWKNTTAEKAFYEMTVVLSVSDTVKNAEITFRTKSDQTADGILYQQTIRYPLSSEWKGDVS